MSHGKIGNEDTIAALATPQGAGGISVIRISGKDAEKIIRLIFRPSGNTESCYSLSPRVLYHGYITDPDNSEIIDEVLCVLMRGPASFTGEDVAEIHCHGGHILPKRILELIYRYGARPAEAGEYSLRAFLNGKMDLSQAEAVSSVITAQTEEGLKQAELQLQGALSSIIAGFKDTVLDMLAEIEAQVDFPEEDIDQIIKERISANNNALISDIDALLKTYNEGRMLKNGVRTAIIGRPNVGKSSLLNRLLRQDRAIVSPEPGTTRDFIEEAIDINGIPLVIADTAGIRMTEDNIEKAGVELTRKKARDAELVLAVLDISTDLTEDDYKVLEMIEGKPAVAILNKSDIEAMINESRLSAHIASENIVETSAVTGSGIDELKNKITQVLLGSGARSDGSEVILTELRHKHALSKARVNLKGFADSLDINESPEFLALSLRLALDALGEITGEITTDDVLGRIFSKFCVGK